MRAHESLGSVGIMDIAWTVQDIEDLTGLSNGTEKRKIASGSLLLLQADPCYRRKFPEIAGESALHVLRPETVVCQFLLCLYG
jgi:hypothetical protein